MDIISVTESFMKENADLLMLGLFICIGIIIIIVIVREGKRRKEDILNLPKTFNIEENFLFDKVFQTYFYDEEGLRYIYEEKEKNIIFHKLLGSFLIIKRGETTVEAVRISEIINLSKRELKLLTCEEDVLKQVKEEKEKREYSRMEHSQYVIT